MTRMRQDPPAPQDPRPPHEDAIERHRDALKRQFPMPRPEELARRKKPGKGTAVLALLLLVASLIGWDPGWDGAHYASAIGLRRTIDLPDGSRVTLDTGSRIATRWHLRSRRIVLEAGRARFEVAPSRWRPFHVDAGQAGVQVVGTIFDVRRDTGGVEVAVLRGQVAVSSQDKAATRMLHPGQRVLAHAGAIDATTALDVHAQSDWIDGRIEFDRTPLGQALAELQRYRRQPIVLADPHLADIKVSGVFDSARVDEALELLPQILPVRVVHQADGSARVQAR